MSRLASARSLALVIPVALVALTACSGPATASAPSSSVTPVPTRIDNCGFELDITETPERIVTIKSTSTELLLALGLGDRIVGQAFSDGPVPEPWAAQAATIPEISTKVPGKEAVLALEPDMIFAGWESNVTAEGAGDRSALDALGVRSYVAPSACKGAGYQPDHLTFEHVFRDIEEAGRVFGADDAARDLVDAQRDALQAIEPVSGGLTAVWYSSGTDVPYVGAGKGAPQMLLEAAGLVNLAAGVDDTWASYNWEAIVDANPDVIVLVDSSWNTAARKRELLETNPALAQMDAVKNQRYVIVPFAGSEAGVRNVDVVASIVDQVNSLELPSDR